MNISKKSTVSPELMFYIKTFFFSVFIFGLFYVYTAWLVIPNALNKTFADTAIVLMGMSMILSGLAYFFNFFKPLLIYRKYLGLVGFAFLFGHLVLSFSALQSLFSPEVWVKGTMWPALSGFMATLIFLMMAVISNRFAARRLGGTRWRFLLRLGYLAMMLSVIHVVLLKSARWVTWYQGGLKTLPSLSLLVSIGAIIVILFRIVLWLNLRKK